MDNDVFSLNRYRTKRNTHDEEFRLNKKEGRSFSEISSHSDKDYPTNLRQKSFVNSETNENTGRTRDDIQNMKLNEDVDINSYSSKTHEIDFDGHSGEIVLKSGSPILRVNDDLYYDMSQQYKIPMDYKLGEFIEYYSSDVDRIGKPQSDSDFRTKNTEKINDFYRSDDNPTLAFDRAFFYAVRHNPTGLLLFTGRYLDPDSY